MSNTINILIADDHSYIRVGLKSIIDDETDMTLVGEASCGREAIDLCKKHRPHVMVLDYGLPDIDGLEVTKQITAQKDISTRILILTMHDSEEYAVRLIRAGAAGFMVKDSSAEQLPTAIRKVAIGGTFISPSLFEAITMKSISGETPCNTSDLSDRELQVIIRLAKGLSTNEISDELNLGYSTVDNYKRRSLEKLGLRNDADLTRFAIRNNLIDNV